MTKIKVLIAGAGPTGLMMACQLQRMGIDCIIFDKKKGPTVESRALVIHARSLEIYDQMGIADEAVVNGEIIKTVRFLSKKRKLAEAMFGSIGRGMSKFPYLLVYEQNKNERLLYEYFRKMGGNVLWEHELISVKQNDDAVHVDLKDEQGNILTVEAGWLVAADGAKSHVRNDLNLSFEGDTYEHIFFVADTKLEWPWGHDALDLYVSKSSFLGLFPMQGENRFRAIGILPAEYQNEYPESFEQIIPYIQEKIKIPLKFSETSWFSVYRLHHRCVQQFRVNRIFLCGDAAHIHSPAGGQGMNTGLQDAYNLAWKLAYVVRGFADKKILDTYQQERLPFAKQLMVSTDRGFAVLTSPKWLPRFVRMFVLPYVMPVLIRFEAFRRFIFKTISQIRISYYHSALTFKTRDLLKVKAGQRLPYILFNDGSCLYDKINEMKFHLLLFSKNTHFATAPEISLFTTAEFKSVLDVLEIDRNEQTVFHQLGVKEDVVMLVRPDHYIACFAPANESGTILEYLRRLKN